MRHSCFEADESKTELIFDNYLLLQHSIQRHPLVRAIHNGIFKTDVLVKIKFFRRRWINRDTLDRDSFVGRLGQVNTDYCKNHEIAICSPQY